MKCRIFFAALAFAVSGRSAVVTDSFTFFYEVLGADNETPLCSSALGTCGAYEASVRWQFNDASRQAAFDPESGKISVAILNTFVADNFLETNSVRFTSRRRLEFDGIYVVGAPGDPPQTTVYTYLHPYDPDGPRTVHEFESWNSLFPLFGTGVSEFVADFTPTPGVPFRVNFGLYLNQTFFLFPESPRFASDDFGIGTLSTDPPLNAREIPEPRTIGLIAVGLGVLGWVYVKRAAP